jgi:hypothetical protein
VGIVISVHNVWELENGLDTQQNCMQNRGNLMKLKHLPGLRHTRILELNYLEMFTRHERNI